MTENSSDFSNLIRDVAPDFDTLIANSPSFLRLLGSVGTTFNMAGSPVVKNTKFEWVNDPQVQFSSAIASFATDGDGVTFDVASSAGFQVDSILRIESSLGASHTELMQVTNVNANGTTITVLRDYGSTTGVLLVVGDEIILNSTPRQEDSDVGVAIAHESVLDFNFTEIFDEVANLSNTAKAVLAYDNAVQMAVQMRASMIRLARKLEAATIHGVRVQRTASVNGTLGGILQFISQAGGNIDATGGSLSEALINNVVEEIVIKGGDLSNGVLLLSVNQSRKLSALNTTGANPLLNKEITDRTLGQFVTRFIGDLPVDDKGTTLKVFVSQNMKKDQVAILDMNKINLKVMRGLTTKDATTNGTDGDKQRMLMETTLEVRNAKESHGIVTGLTL